MRERAAMKIQAQHHERLQAAATPVEYNAKVPIPGRGFMSFWDFPFSEEWYSEEVANAQDVTLVKSAQVGASEWAFRAGVRQADEFGDVVLYIMPTDIHVKEFSDDRVDPAIDASKHLLARIHGKVRTKSLKKIGAGSIYFRGSNSKAGAQSISAQMVVFDEYDLLDQGNLPQIERRTAGAAQIGKQKRFRRLGYPYTHGGGLDKQWKSTDQRVWHVKCPACGEEQPITWEENVRWTMPGVVDEHGFPVILRPGDDKFEDPKMVGEVWRQCREYECQASFEEDDTLHHGRWIKQNPGAPHIGFYVWRGMVPLTDLVQLVVASRGETEKEREAFFVLDLGRPYTSGAAQLTAEDLANAQRLGLERMVAGYGGSNPVTMGLDIGDGGGKGHHYVIHEQLPYEVENVPNPRRMLAAGVIHSEEEWILLMERFRVAMCAVDFNPARDMVRGMAARYPGRIVPVEFNTSPFSDPIKLDTNEIGMVKRAIVNRTDMLDGMMHSIRVGRSRPCRAMPAKWAEQMMAPVRKTEFVKKTGVPYRTYESAGADDYAFAEGYALVAQSLWSILGVAAMDQHAATTGHIVTDEQMGITRGNLRPGAGNDEYRPGFGERI